MAASAGKGTAAGDPSRNSVSEAAWNEIRPRREALSVVLPMRAMLAGAFDHRSSAARKLDRSPGHASLIHCRLDGALPDLWPGYPCGVGLTLPAWPTISNMAGVRRAGTERVVADAARAQGRVPTVGLGDT